MISAQVSASLRRSLLVWLLFTGMVVSLRAQPVISSFSPPRNTTATAVSDNIVLTWSQAMSTATLTSGTIRVHGSMTGRYTTNASISYSGGNTVVTVNPAQNFKRGELISVSVTNAQSAANVPMTRATVWSFLASAQGGHGTFGTAATFTTGAEPASVETSDFNRDGILDLAVANADGNNVSVLMGTGSGTFGAATNYATANGAGSVQSGDLDGDGDPDLLVSNFNTAFISVLLNNGSGGFGAATNVNVDGFARHITPGDFDGDGDLDVIAARDNVVALLRNNGSAVFSFAGTFSVGAGVQAHAVDNGDFDGDGDLDIVVTHLGTSANVVLLLNNGSGSFSTGTTYTAGNSPYSVCSGDLDGDGDLDLVVANTVSSTISVFLNNGSGSFGAAVNYEIGSGPDAILSDLDGDGDLDLVVARGNFGSFTISVLLNNGSGVFGTPAGYTVGDAPSSVCSGDFDGDGDLDLAAANSEGNNVSVLLNQLLLRIVDHTPSSNTHNAAPESDIDMTFNTAVSTATITAANVRVWGEQTGLISTKGTFSASGTTATFDYNSLFKPGELITVEVTRAVKSAAGANLYEAALWQFRATTAQASGINSLHTNVPTMLGPYSVALGDVNSDGNIDIATANRDFHSISIRLGNGAGGFSGTTEVVGGTGPEYITLSDLNGDGHLDIATANNSSHTVSIHSGNGAGNFSNTATLPAPIFPKTVLVGDVNNDGTPDIVSSNADTLAVHLGNGTGSFSALASVPLGISSLRQALGDVNNDGKLDLVATSSTNATVVFLGTGTGSFIAYSSVTVGTTGTSVVLGDINGDGSLDLATVNHNSSTVSVRMGDGAGNFSGTTDVPVHPESYDVVLGDLNGDGHADIVSSSSNMHRLSVRMGDGTGNFSGTYNPSVGVVPMGVALGDVNNDGRLDIAAANYFSHTVSILLGQPYLSLVSHTPIANAQDVAPGDNITMTFSTTLSVSTVTAANVRVWGEQTGLISTKGTFSASGTTATFDYNSLFKPGELITVSVTQAVKSAAGVNLSEAAVWQFRATTAQADATFNSRVDVAIANSPSGIALGDVNSDGHLDFATSNFAGNTVSVRLGDGTGNFSGTTNLVVQNVVTAVAMGDVNNDGNLDIAASSRDGSSVSIRLGDGAGNFSGTTDVPVGAGPFSVALADVNGDGKLDIATGNRDAASVSIRLGDGAGNFSGATEVPAESWPITTALGDINNDGKTDLLAANYLSHSISVYLGDGAGNFDSVTTLPVPNQPQGIALGDVNGDGYIDFATASYAGGVVVVRLGDGTGNFSAAANVSPGNNPNHVTLGDVNGDGHLDIVASNFNGQSVSVRLGDGAGNFNGTTNVAVQNAPAQTVLGDVDGDGKLDIAAANYGANSVSILLNVPANTAPVIATTSTVFSTNEDTPLLISVALSDVNSSTSALVVIATSGNQSIVRTDAIVQQGATAGTTQFLVTPATNANGVVNITLTATDPGGLSSTTTFTLTVLSVNDAPVVSTNQTVMTTPEDMATTLTVALIDIDNAYGSLTVTATSANQSIIPNSGIVQSGATGATTSFTLVPAANANGTAQITVAVSDGLYTSTTVLTVTVLPVNDAPTVSTTQTAMTATESVTRMLTVAVGDIDTPYGNLTVSATSGNQNLISNGSITQSSSTGATTTFSFTPSANTSGTVQLAITVSDGQYSATTTFVVTVLPVNDAPMMSTTHTAVVVNEDGSTTLTITVVDPDTPYSGLVVTATSDNQALVPDANLVQSSATGATTSFTLAPAADASGITQVTVTVSDGQYSATTTFVVTIIPVNDAPMVSTTQTALVATESVARQLSVTVSDVDTPYGNLTVVVTSGNQALVSNSSITQSGSTGATTVFFFTPAANTSGTVQLSVTVSDGQYSATTTFVVTVLPVNDAPMISTTQTAIAVNEDVSTTLTAMIGDLDTPYSGLVVTAASDNEILVPSAALVQMGATGATTSFVLTPAANAYGTAHVTVTVSDGQYSAATTFVVTVLPVNDGPTVGTTQTVMVTNEDTATTLTVTVGDIDTPGLTVTATSNNQTLVPNGSIIQIGATGATTSFTLMPAADANGTAYITVTVSDGQYSATTIVTVTVLPVNDGPVVSTTQTALATPDDTQLPVTVSIADIDTPYSGLTVTATSGNQTMLPNGNIVQSGATGATTSFVLTPIDNQTGVVAVMVTVSDGQYSASTVLTITINESNLPPGISTTQTAITTNEDTAVAVSVVIGDDDNGFEELTLTATSGNQILIPNANIVQQGMTTATPVFVITPAANQSGVASITITVSDGQYSATTTLSITVLPVNDSPVVSTTQTVIAIHEDASTTLTVLLADIDDVYSELTVTATSSNTSVIPNSALTQSNSTGATTSFALTPAANASGTAQITITASDGQYSTITTFTVIVLPVNDAPTISTTSTLVTTNEDASSGLTVSIFDADNGYGVLTVTATSSNLILLPNSGIAQNGSAGATTSFTITPAANAHGTAQVTVVVSDGEYSATTTFTVIVMPVNDPPALATNNLLTLAEGSKATISASALTATDIEQSASALTFVVTVTTANGSLLKNGVPTGSFTQTDINSGAISYRHNGGESTSDTFSFSVNDGAGGTTGGLFSFVIIPVNDNPVAVADMDSTCMGSVTVIHVLGNDTDAENNALTVTAVTQPQNGVVSIQGDSVLVYTPSQVFEGTDTFAYTIGDGAGGSSTATVAVTIRSIVSVDAGDDVVLCAESEVQLAGIATSQVGGIEFTWTPAAGLSNPSIANPIARPDTTTLYVLIAIDDNGCRAWDSVLVTVTPSLQYTVSGSADICAGGSVQLSASGGVSYRWWPAAGLSDSTSASPIASPTATTTYHVEITAASGCRITTSATVTVHNAVSAIAGNASMCAGSSVQLQASGGTRYSWSPATGLSDTAIANPIASPANTTVYTVNVSNEAGCTSVTTVTVTVQPVQLQATVLLEGAYMGSGMRTELQAQGILPSAQPYNVAPFNYNGSETVGAVAAGTIVDWVLVEVRTQTTPSSVVARRAALLHANGAVVSTDGMTPLQLESLSGGAGSYYIVIRHRNHLPVMSAVAVGVNQCAITYNFTLSQAAAYRDFLDAQKMLAASAFGMAGGDVNMDGIINAIDRVEVREDSGVLGYLQTDISLDGIVNAVDRVVVRDNTFLISQVP